MTRDNTKKRREYMKKWYHANKEKHLEASRKWQKAHPEEVKGYRCKWRKENHDKKLELQRKWRTANPEKAKAYCDKWREKNKEHTIEYSRRYRETHREKTRESSKQYAKNNPKKRCTNQQNYMARKKNVGGSFTATDIKDLYATQGGRCYYCSVDIEAGYHIDHMFPISRGGTNGPENLALSCAPCNLSKHTKTAEEFMSC